MNTSKWTAVGISVLAAVASLLGVFSFSLGVRFYVLPPHAYLAHVIWAPYTAVSGFSFWVSILSTRRARQLFQGESR